MSAPCPDCRTVHCARDVVAVGRFDASTPTTYRPASGGDIRPTRAEAMADVTSARVYATGQPLPDHDEVLGTALVLDRALVWHVLRRRSPMRPPPPPGPSSVYAPTTSEDPA